MLCPPIGAPRVERRATCDLTARATRSAPFVGSAAPFVCTCVPRVFPPSNQPPSIGFVASNGALYKESDACIAKLGSILDEMEDYFPSKWMIEQHAAMYGLNKYPLVNYGIKCR